MEPGDHDKFTCAQPSVYVYTMSVYVTSVYVK